MSRPHDTRRVGIALAATTAVISGIAVAINGYGVRAWADAGGSAPYTTFKNAVAALLLVGLLAAASARRGGEGFTRPERPLQWLGLAVVAAIGGSVPFLLFFEGLAQATSVDAAFIHKTLVVWVALAAVPLLGERLGPVHVGAIVALLAGHVVLGGGIPGLAFGTGELMILAATLMWSAEVILVKKLLPGLSSLTVAVARMVGGGVLLVGYGIVTGAFSSLAAVGSAQLGWVLVTGVVLTGYVATWYSALARAPAVDVTAVLVGGAVITAIVRTGFQGAALPAPAGLILITAGVVAVVARALRRSTVALPGR